MLRCIACAFYIAVVASWAEAATIHHKYEGKPLSCFGDEQCIHYYETNSLPAFEANLWIDEKSYPGGSLTNSELMLFSTIGHEEWTLIGYSVKTAESTYNFSVQKEGVYGLAFTDYPQFGFVTFDGVVRTAFEGLVGDTAYFKFTFDDSGYISTWAGHSGLQGTSEIDWLTDPTGDFYGLMGSIGPGRWVRITPVPLPFSATLSASGIALLGALGLCRKRCHREPAPS